MLSPERDLNLAEAILAIARSTPHGKVLGIVNKFTLRFLRGPRRASHLIRPTEVSAFDINIDCTHTRFARQRAELKLGESPNSRAMPASRTAVPNR